MPASNAIRAGRAFVELFAEDSKLRRGLARAQAMVRKFGQSIRAKGVFTLQVGLGVTGLAGGLIKALAGPASELEEIQISSTSCSGSGPRGSRRLAISSPPT